MKYISSYTTNDKIRILSAKLELYRQKRPDETYVDPEVISDKLRYNLSWALSHIILNLTFTSFTEEDFIKIISSYNSSNGTNLSITDFKNLQWIRIINDEVLIPTLVRTHLFQINNPQPGRTAEISPDKKHLTNCLLVYYQKYLEIRQLSITLEKLGEILRKTHSTNITTSYLTDRKILKFDSLKNVFYWNGEFTKYLDGEISATIWLLLKEQTKIDFKNYLNLLFYSGIWIGKLNEYLTKSESEKIATQALLFLRNESDLAEIDKEVDKVWYDAQNYSHIDIQREPPVVTFDFRSSYDYIESIERKDLMLYDLFYHQNIRSRHYWAIRLIIQNDKNGPNPYHRTIALLSDTTKPYIVWTIYNHIPKDFPSIIPYLCNDSNLMPLAFKQLDEIEINSAILENSSNSSNESSQIINSLWLELLQLSLENICNNPANIDNSSVALARILLYTANRVFSNSYHGRINKLVHTVFKKRYEILLKELEQKTGIDTNTDSPKLIFSLLPGIYTYLVEHYERFSIHQHEYIELHVDFLDACIKVLKLANSHFFENDLPSALQDNINELSKNLTSFIKNILVNFYQTNYIEVLSYQGTIEQKEAILSGNAFGYEIVDWGYLILHFGKLNILDEFIGQVSDSIKFNLNEDKYDRQNKNQFEKLKLYFKTLTLAYIEINIKRTENEIKGFSVNTTLNTLEELILNYAVKYSANDIPNHRIDIFDNYLGMLNYNLYNQSLTTLLYKSLNYFSTENQKTFVNSFFENSIDIGRMLSAINNIDSPNLIEIISKKIDEIDVKSFIKSVFTSTELQYALIEAVNSKNHWGLATPIVSTLEKHFEKIELNREENNKFLFETNLLLALKEGDWNKLSTMPLPESTYTNNGTRFEDRRRLFTALYHIYHERDYPKAITILKPLASNNSKDIQYSFHLYQAEMLAAVQGNGEGIAKAYENWQRYVDSLSQDEKNGLTSYKDAIDILNILYYISIKDDLSFDQTISHLSKRYLYDEDIIIPVYNFYRQRDLQELAFNYIQGVSKYYDETSTTTPTDVQKFIDNSEDTHLLNKLKLGLEKILTLKSSNVVLITPEVINDKRNLNDFILSELIQATKILLDKIQGIKQISHENRLNDLLLAVLRLRFPIWGWALTDQPRMGDSATGKDAGEIDLVIQSGGQSIGLIEALILEGKNESKTQSHLQKCFGYSQYLSRYYMIVYYKGLSTNYESTWESYQSDILSASIPDDLKIDDKRKFVDLSPLFTDIRNIKIAKTIHNSNVEVFHIMINLGT